jgi:hypothetical protein
MERPFVTENARERERLKSLVSRLTDAQLSQPLDENWTVAVAFAHLAFWDNWALSRMRKWASKGVAPEPIDFEIANESLLSLWRVLPPRVAADLAVSAAEAVDQAIEDAPAALISEIERLEERTRLYRSDHRKMHLDEIEAVIR